MSEMLALEVRGLHHRYGNEGSAVIAVRRADREVAEVDAISRGSGGEPRARWNVAARPRSGLVHCTEAINGRTGRRARTPTCARSWAESIRGEPSDRDDVGPIGRCRFVAGGVVAGCTGGDSPDANERPSLQQIASEATAKGYDWQAKVLSDGNITLAEYDEALRRNR